MRALLNKSNKNRKALDLDFLEELYKKQEGKCAISGETMTYQSGEGRIATNISIDQILPNKGYYPENVQLVCLNVNIIKSDQSMEELIEWCKKVVDYNCRKT